MKIFSAALLTLAAASPFAASELQPASTEPIALEESGAKRHADTDWYRIVHVTFKAGQAEKGIGIIREHFKPCTREAGTPDPQIMINETGDHNLTVIWTLPEGTRSLDWETSPQSVKWRETLAKRMGGEAEAKALMEDYRNCVQSYSTDLARSFAPTQAKPTEASAK